MVVAMVATALSDPARGENIAFPAVTGGQVVSRKAGPRTLTPVDITKVMGWLEQHRSGWQPNLATSPVPDVTLSLQTNSQTPVVVVSLWPNAREAAWRHSVLLEDLATRTTRIQTFMEEDEAVLLSFVR